MLNSFSCSAAGFWAVTWLVWSAPHTHTKSKAHDVVVASGECPNTLINEIVALHASLLYCLATRNRNKRPLGNTRNSRCWCANILGSCSFPYSRDCLTRPDDMFLDAISIQQHSNERVLKTLEDVGRAFSRRIPRPCDWLHTLSGEWIGDVCFLKLTPFILAW